MSILVKQIRTIIINYYYYYFKLQIMITQDAISSHKMEWMGLTEKLPKNLLHVGDSQRNELLLLKLSSSASVSYFVLHQHSDISSCKA